MTLPLRERIEAVRNGQQTPKTPTKARTAYICMIAHELAQAECTYDRVRRGDHIANARLVLDEIIQLRVKFGDLTDAVGRMRKAINSVMP